MGTDGSVAYLFNKLGVVQVDLSHDEDQIMEIALDAGADDFPLLKIILKSFLLLQISLL
jgi:transcriptional/translational regulatory protein YebC/TACO1